MAVHLSGESIDPFHWLFTDDGVIQDGPYEEFCLEDLYDDLDANMDPIRDLVYTPNFELFMLKNKDRQENATIADVALGYPYMENWEQYMNIRPRNYRAA
jgi:hypothetical protein